MLTSAVRFVAAKGRSPATIQLLCHVKPGVNANREGIAAVTDETIEICVAAQAREGEANKAVREVIAQTLKVPKSNVDVIKGMKSREKTVAVSIDTKDAPDEVVNRIKNIILESVRR